MDPYGMTPPPPLPQKPKKPDPAARRMRPLDYVALLLGVEPPPPDAHLPPPVGYVFPDHEPVLPPPVAALPPPPMPDGPGVPPAYQSHVMRMRGRFGF